MMWFAPEQIFVEPGWNERDWSDPKTEEHIERIKESILKNGYDQTQPIAVKKKKIDGTDTVVLRDGEHRLRAALRAKQESGRADILLLAVSLSEGMDEFDELALQARSNSGKPNTPLETARQVKRLKQMRPDANNGDIAIAINKSRQTVDNALALLEMPIPIQQMVGNGEISATFAIAFVEEHGDRAVSLLKEKLAALRVEGKSKVTAKHFKSDAVAPETAQADTTPIESSEPDEAADAADAPSEDDSTTAETEPIKTTEPVEKQITLKQLVKDIIESAEYGECTAARKWVGIETELWQQLLELTGGAK